GGFLACLDPLLRHPTLVVEMDDRPVRPGQVGDDEAHAGKEFPEVERQHDALAPHARWRSQVISYGRSNPEPSARPFDASPRAAGTPDAWPWAALLRRVFVHPINCNSRRGGDRARPGHASLPSAVRADARRRRAAAQL